MALYDFATRRNDLQSKFAAEQLAQEQGRFVGQKRFGRQRQDMTQGFQRGFPRMTGQFAGRLGSGVKSGVFGEKLGQTIGDYRQRMADVDVDEAQMLAGFQSEEALRRAVLENALRALADEERMYGLGNKR